MIIDAGLILEGGGTRCVYTAGILDYFMEQDIYFKNVYALSASAYVALNYVSKQIRRTKESLIDKISSEFFSWRSLFTTGDIYNTRLLFDELPNGSEMPFDYDTFFKSEQKLTMSVTRMKTGQPVYFNSYSDPKDLMRKCRASNCFPILTKIQYFDGDPVLDGGMADAVPLKKALDDGISKNVVILTQPHGYRKKIKKSPLVTLRYFRYPKFVKVVNRRPLSYNSQVELVEKKAEAGEILVYNPTITPPPLITRKKDVLLRFYEHGYESAKTMLPEILKFVGIENGSVGE